MFELTVPDLYPKTLLADVTMICLTNMKLCNIKLKHFDTLFYSSEEHFLSDNLDKVSKCFKIVKGPPIQSLLQIISPRLRLGDIIL